jgi:hypothetical protein
MRAFRDDGGTEWTVWEVRPGQIVIGASERRAGHDRRVAPAPDPVIERRRGRDRRVEARQVATGLGSDLAGGWLAFQAGAVRRRLAPVPDGWDRMSDAELVALCGRAATAARATRGA